jgi:hypothetical protein
MIVAGKGIRASVARDALSDFTLGGISSEAREVTVVGVLRETGANSAGQAAGPVPGSMREHEPSPDAPAVILVIRETAGRMAAYMRPVRPRPRGPAAALECAQAARCLVGRVQWPRRVAALGGRQT